MPGVLVDLGGGTFLDDPSRVHHREPVAGVGEHRQVVADHHQPHVLVGDQLLDEAQDLRLDHHVQRGGRLVRDDQAGSQASASAIITRCR
ncbi:hypothetical protein ACFQV4_31245 [Streptomyces thermocarboxydus]